MFLNRFVNRILFWLRITRGPVIKLYDGFGDADEIVVQGHLLRLSPLPRTHYRDNFLINFFALIRLFIVQPKKGVRVQLDFQGETITTTTEKDGFFRFEWKPNKIPLSGWHQATATYHSPLDHHLLAMAKCKVFVPHPSQYSFISDIDDTFLISHSNSLYKRLFVLFSKNARSRMPFEGVVNHYRLLARAGSTALPNPFFYVSSSEWNLYDYIREFVRRHELPLGVLMLAQIKRFSDLLKTGQGKHASKYIRITRIFKAFPNHQYVLLGDNTQMDPEIYKTVANDFKENVYAVYIRRVSKRKDEATKKLIAQIEANGVHCCYFSNSAEAIEHSERIGLIKRV